jgi:signal transduction histidine kinase
VLFNAVQLHQLLLNLCMNAGDAFDGRAGSITIRLDAIGLDHVDRARFAGVPVEPGIASATGGTLDPACGYAVVRVIDDGGGMDQQTLDVAFEPFFTTKRRRHGTGLGLAVVHGILQSGGGGAYAVRSWPGVGTEFSIYLPLEAGVRVDPAAPRRRCRSGAASGFWSSTTSPT